LRKHFSAAVALLCVAALAATLAGCSREKTDTSETGQPAPSATTAPAPAPEPDRYPQQTSPGEEGARKFVQAFMRARTRGNVPRARAFLSGEALAQYNTGTGGLVLAGPANAQFTDWEFGTVKAADASSFEINVRVTQDAPGGATGAFEETLFVGPGPDFQQEQRPWIIRGAQRVPIEPNQ
jgi:hypothetical protein